MLELLEHYSNYKQLIIIWVYIIVLVDILKRFLYSYYEIPLDRYDIKTLLKVTHLLLRNNTFLTNESQFSIQDILHVLNFIFLQFSIHFKNIN